MGYPLPLPPLDEWIHTYASDVDDVEDKDENEDDDDDVDEIADANVDESTAEDSWWSHWRTDDWRGG